MVSQLEDGAQGLELAGWKISQATFCDREGSTCWQVDARLRGHTVIAWGRTRQEAWRVAERQLQRIQRAG